MNRREFIRSALLLSGASLLDSCCLNYPMLRDPKEICTRSVARKALSGAPSIDVHCHVFNASDLQVEGFVREVISHDWNIPEQDLSLLASLLADMSGLAPSATEEYDEIWQFLEANKQRFKTSRLDELGRFEDPIKAQDRRFRQRLIDLINAKPEYRMRFEQMLRRYYGPPPKSGKLAKLGPEAVNATTQALRTGTLDDATVQAVLALPIGSFLEPMFSYRYSNCYSLVEAYSCSPGLVDLYVPSLVDYDYWLGDPLSTNSTERQIDTMEQVMRLMGGFVHCFVPFNPLKQILEPGSFDVLKKAVLQQGFIGFKLYPPMGFAPYGNVDVKTGERPEIWSKIQVEDLPTKLDTAMMALFNWCSENDVPIMAHSNPSNALDYNSELMGCPGNWDKAFAAMGASPPAISFGHLGGDKPQTDPKLRWGPGFADTIGRQPRAFGDLSYWALVLRDEDDEERRSALEALGDLITQQPLLKKRLMYGTDWNMLAMETDWESYFEQFSEAMQKVVGNDPETLEGLLGGNAVEYLGLKKANHANNRSRLESFYKRWQIDTPPWMSKVDRLG